MNQQSTAVRVWLSNGNCVNAHLTFSDQPVLISLDGDRINTNGLPIEYEISHELIMDKSGMPYGVQLSTPVRAYLPPKLITRRKYSATAKESSQDIFPPSSFSFYGRLIRGKSDAVYIVQDMVNDAHFWLTVLDPVTNIPWEAHRIQPYEFDAIAMKMFYDYWDELVAAFIPKNSEQIVKDVIGILDRDNLVWSEIHRLTLGLIPPSFVMGRNARDTLSNIIPIDEYPVDTREEILTFLAWVAKQKMPEGDLIRFLDIMHALPLFRSLFLKHLTFLFYDQKPPNYLRLAEEATKEKAKGSRLLDETAKGNPEWLLRNRIDALMPPLHNDLIDMVRSFIASRKVIVTLHTENSSSGNRRNMKERLLVYNMGLRLRAHVYLHAIGLKELVYYGFAHRWPHKHLSYSLRLGPEDSKSPYIHGIVVSPSAEGQIKRVLPNILDIEWSSFSLNLELYNQRKERWHVRRGFENNITEKDITLKQLKSRFGLGERLSTYRLSNTETRILDLASTMLYLSDMESKAGQEYWNIDAGICKRILTNLRNKHIINVSYWFNWLENTPTLSRIFLYLQGCEKKVCAFTQEALTDFPTSLARVANGGNDALIASRIPSDDQPRLISMMKQIAEEQGVNIRVFFPSASRNFSAGLFQRLARPDGTWDDDVSGFLSQVRSAPKSLLEDIQ
jgi:hypothetical protein